MSLNQCVFTSDMVLVKNKTTAPIMKLSVRQVHGEAREGAQARGEQGRDPA
jgi:hypothetical protein